ncbi:MAG: hypothetical protein WCJ62_00360 [Flavobacterium sp.]
MARLLQEPKEEHLDYLRELITNKFSKPIVNSNDCKLLEDAIQEANNLRLSVDTLARLFGIKKSASSPSIFTLDTCSIYVGYASWKDLVTSYLDQNELYQKALLFEIMEHPISFDELVTRLNEYPKSIALFETFRQIMLFKVQQKDEAFFERLFEIKLLFEYQENYKYAIYNTVHLLSILCHKHDWLSKIAIQHYANLSYTFNYFVEWVVVPERAYYLPLLERYCYYKANDNAALLFYHLILCTYYGEKKEWNQFDAHYSTITYFIVETAALNNILQMRWFGVQLYYNVYHNEFDLQDALLNKIVNSNYINHNDSGHRVSNIFMICNYLFIAEKYETIITLFEEKTNERSDILGYWAELNYNQLKVYYAFSLVRNERKERAIEVFKQIKPDRFDLNFKNRMIAVYKSL